MSNENGNGGGGARPPRYKKAEKTGIHARIALCGPSGSGKSYTALRLARGLAGEKGKIFVLDTERGRIKRYADRFDFYEAQITKYGVDEYISAIQDAAAEGAAVLIIDSGSHAWIASGGGGILDEKDKIAARSNSNNFNAWAELTPQWSRFLNTILGVNCHTITTIRSKTKWEVEAYTDARGNTKHKPVKVGTKPEFRDGSEYEFDLWGELDVEHTIEFSKTSEGLPEKPIAKPGEELGAQIREWCNSQRAEAWKDVAAAIEARERELEGSLDRADVATWFDEKFEGKKKSEFTLDEVRFLTATIGDYIVRNGQAGRLEIRLSQTTPPFDPDPPKGGSPADEPGPETPHAGAQTPGADHQTETPPAHAASSDHARGASPPPEPEGAPVEPDTGERVRQRIESMGRAIYGDNWTARPPEGPAPAESDELFGDGVNSAETSRAPTSFLDH